jgi:hypothetical protein
MANDDLDKRVFWWKNPYPNYAHDVAWEKRTAKSSGASKHHHQMFCDFDGDGKAELVFWNQGMSCLFLAEIPPDPLRTRSWPRRQVYYYSGKEHEGLAKVDVDGDGKLDIVGGGRWFKHEDGTRFTTHMIDDTQRSSKAAAGQLKKGGWPEVVFCPSNAIGRLKWYEREGDRWVAHDVLGFDVVHGHSLELADFDQDGNLDIFCAEMHTPGHGDKATMWIFFGDGKGNFKREAIATGIGNHESQVGDLDGDGDIDILGKPYSWDTPRVDVWLNETVAPARPPEASE